MNVVAFAVQHEIEDVLRSGFSHAIFGAFLDAGSYGRIRDVAPGRLGLEHLFGLDFDAAARASGVDLERARSPLALHDRARPRLVLVEAPQETNPAGIDEDAWHAILAAGDTLALVVADLSNVQAPLWILMGHGLPVMGLVEPCSREDLWNTWLTIAGGVSGAARFLLEELQETHDPLGEQALGRRLRELYGES